MPTQYRSTTRFFPKPALTTAMTGTMARTKETAVYSWGRAVKVCDGNAETNLKQGDATLQRLIKEIERRRKA